MVYLCRRFTKCFFYVISKDFMDIFMAAGGVKNINDPDHAEFIS